MTAYILGAGPTGMALAQGLAEQGKTPFVLIESEEEPGGLARTVTSPGLGRHDLGPHKLYSADPALMARVKNLLPADQWLVRPKRSRIYLGGHFLPYPPSPLSLLRLFGVRALSDMALDFIRARARRPTAPAATFEEDLSQRVGAGLYQRFFRPMAEKIWGDPTQLDARLSRDRVQLPTLGDFFRRRPGRFEAPHFYYPRGGLQTLWRAMERGFPSENRRLFHHAATRLSWNGGRVAAVTVQNRATRQEHCISVGPNDFVFSTLPLPTLSALSPEWGDPLRQRIREASPAQDLWLVFIKIREPRLLNESWIFVPDPAIPFHRVSEPNAFDPAMTPSGSIVCCEFMGGPARPSADITDRALIDSAMDGLHRMGYRFAVENARVIRLPGSYPVMRPGADERRDGMLAALDEFDNFRSIGRQGSAHYVGTLDAMDIGFGAARWLDGGRTRAGWADERRRTRRYPILD